MRARRAAPRHFPDARRAPKSTTDHATLEMAIVPFGWEPPCRVRPEPADSSPCHQYPPSAHVGRAPRAMRHVLAGGCQPAKPHPYTRPCPCSSAPGSTDCPAPRDLPVIAPVACGHTPCLRRARPPYAPAHTWQAHMCNQHCKQHSGGRLGHGDHGHGDPRRGGRHRRLLLAVMRVLDYESECEDGKEDRHDCGGRFLPLVPVRWWRKRWRRWRRRRQRRRWRRRWRRRRWRRRGRRRRWWRRDHECHRKISVHDHRADFEDVQKNTSRRGQLGRQCGRTCGGQNVGGGSDLGDDGATVAWDVVGDDEPYVEHHAPRGGGGIRDQHAGGLVARK